MSDIDLYQSTPEKYNEYQHTRLDYSVAIDRAIELAAEKLKNKGSDVWVADFCSGTGSNTFDLVQKLGSIKKATLIDINQHFLEQAKASQIKAEAIETIHSNILEAPINTGYDCVLSLFAYHHVTDDKKQRFIDQVKQALNPGGIFVLGEIYMPDRPTTIAYYDKLIQAIPEEKRSAGLVAFLEQTARSTDVEFKIPKLFATDQLIASGFSCIVEEKIWPNDDVLGKDVGTFVQIWQLIN